MRSYVKFVVAFAYEFFAAHVAREPVSPEAMKIGSRLQNSTWIHELPEVSFVSFDMIVESLFTPELFIALIAHEDFFAVVTSFVRLQTGRLSEAHATYFAYVRSISTVRIHVLL